MLKYADFIPVYPDLEDPEIQWKISKKKEFAELTALIREPPPKRGEYYRHQKLFMRYLRQYDRCLNIQETGTGKTCAFVALAEYYKVHRQEIKRVYVLEKGPSTKNDFKHQIVHNCTAGEYETKMVRNAAKDTVRKSNMTREISKWYSILTYKGLINEVVEHQMSDEDIIKTYSGCIFLVDEAHNLRNDLTSGNRAKDVPVDPEDPEESPKRDEQVKKVYNVLWRIFHLIKRSKVILATATPMINSVNEIAPLMNLILPANFQMPVDWDYSQVTLNQVEPFFRGRVTYIRGLDTGAHPQYMGTVIKDTYEILVPSQYQSREVRFECAEAKWTGSNLQIVGPPQPKVELESRRIDSQVKVFPSRMYRELNGVKILTVQGEGYQNAMGHKEQQFFGHEREASCFVFPDRSCGGSFPRLDKNRSKERGLGKYVTSDKADSYTTSAELKDWIVDDYKLNELSSKYSQIISLETERQKQGNSFCFTEFRTGSGAILLGQCFEARGWERFDESQSVFEMSSDINVKRKLKASFSKGRRFGLLTSDTSNSKADTLLELFNSDDNAYGEYCQVMIGSPTARDGINLFNVVRAYLVTPGWHPSGMHQALSRFLRSISHEALLKNKRLERASELLPGLIEAYTQMGLSDVEEKARHEAEAQAVIDVTIDVEIYKMASIPANGNCFDTQNRPITLPEHNVSVDLQLYQHSERKDLYIKRMMRYLKRCAFDALINYERNVRSDDIDGSSICDYDSCRYMCVNARQPILKDPHAMAAGQGPLPSELDYSTYDIYYSDEIVESCVQSLITLIRERGSITFTELQKMWVETNKYRNMYINMAVEKLIVEKRSLLDRFGFGCYLFTDGVIVYTQREFPTSEEFSRQELSIYGEQVVGIKSTPFNEIVDRRQTVDQGRIVQELREIADPLGADENKFIEKDNLLSLVTKVRLLEESLINIIEMEILSKTVGSLTQEQNRTFIFSFAFVNRHKAFVFDTPEPWNNIEKAREAMVNQGQGRGRKRKEGSRPKIDYDPVPELGSLKPDGTVVEKIYLHTLNSNEVDLTSYAVTSKFNNVDGNIRIYKRSEGLNTWRRVLDYEFVAYNHIIAERRAEQMKKFNKFPVYGTVFADGNMRVIDTTVDISDDDDDGRTRPRGEICTTWGKPKLVNILLRENIMPPENTAADATSRFTPKDGKTSRELMIKYLLDKKYTKNPNRVLNVTVRTDSEILFLCRWYLSNYTREHICAILKDYFIKTGRLLVT